MRISKKFALVITTLLAGVAVAPAAAVAAPVPTVSTLPFGN